MAQWDTDQQAWAQDEQAPQPGLRGSRVLLLMTVAALLCAALGYGAWQLLQDVEWGSSEPFPGVSLS